MNYRPWSSEEVAALRQGAPPHGAVKALARALRRTPGAVRNKISREGLGLSRAARRVRRGIGLVALAAGIRPSLVGRWLGVTAAAVRHWRAAAGRSAEAGPKW